MSHGPHRRRNLARQRLAPGSRPGTLQVDPNAPPPVVTRISYDPRDLHTETGVETSSLKSRLADATVTWIDVTGLGDAAVIEAIGDTYGIHRLSLEDVLNTTQRAKADTMEDYVFVVLRMPRGASPLSTEQFSLLLGEDFVITFQELPGDCLEPVRRRLEDPNGRLRNRGADYLAYAILDAIIDSYFPVLEHYGDLLQDLEDEIIAETSTNTIARLHQTKRELGVLRRYVWPIREITMLLTREDATFIEAQTRDFLRDCYDHAIQLLELTETSRDTAGGLMDFYLSTISNRMNEVMKVLTIIATIFIPLSFVAGLYGMNFNTETSRWNLPELSWTFGYPYALGLMLVIALGLLVYFRRRKWL